MQTQHKPALVPPANDKAPFHFTLIKPSDALVNGQIVPVPCLVQSTLPLGGLSILGAKPKHGKSSLSRYISVCIAKGKPCLGLDTMQGESLILNLEDQLGHVVTCLDTLGWDEKKDGMIHIVQDLSPIRKDNLDALAHVLDTKPDVRFVCIDHLALLLRVSDVGDYSKVQRSFMKLHALARAYPKVHIMALTHCKKVQTDDPFDGFLGSTALRGQPDTNIVIYQADGRMYITSEGRVGKKIPATELLAEMTEDEDGEVISNFSLGKQLSLMQSEQAEKKAAKKEINLQGRIVDFLAAREGYSSELKEILSTNVTGNRSAKGEAIKELVAAGVLKSEEQPGQGSPETITLLVESPAYDMFTLGRRA